MKWCVIGAGGIADRRTIPAILADRGSKLLAVMDKNEQTAKIIGKKYGVPYYSDEKEMLFKHDCDAVYIGTPIACHYEQALTCLHHGVHVFMEKPIAMDCKSGAEIVAKFKEKGKLLFIGYMMKYHNLHEQAKKIVQEGRIGKTVDVRLQFSCWYPDIVGAWRQKKALGGGGAIMDLAVHCIELIEFILDDEIAEVKAFYCTQTFSYEVEDSAVICFKTSKGVLGHIDVNFNIPDNCSESKMEIYGTGGYVICKGTLGQEEKGTLSFLQSTQSEYAAKQNRTVGKPQKFVGGGANIYLKQIRDFCAQVKENRLDYSWADRAVQVQQIVDKIYAE